MTGKTYTEGEADFLIFNSIKSAKWKSLYTVLAIQFH